MKVLVACEESQAVCIAFRNKGHESYSCDILPCSGGHPEWHIQGDAIAEAYSGKYNMMIAHPPCTRLTVSANKWYKKEFTHRFPNIHEEREAAVLFFIQLYNSPIAKIAIENPVGIISTRFRKPNCIIQPFQFGHPTTKKTCLWLKNLPLLIPTNIVEPEWIIAPSGNKHSPFNYNTLLLPHEERRKVRSKTYSGIAAAMAEQWG